MKRSAILIAMACLFVFSVQPQSLDKVVLSSGWQMQDATVVHREGKEAGWEMVNSAKVPQEGREVSKLAYQPKNWYSATVPGTVLTTLVNNGVYPEPLYGENNRPEIIPEALCHTDWWYRTVVAIPDSYQDKNIWLNFDGINYEADVWVNGTRVGPVKGAFIRGKFDITSYVKQSKEAAIAVRISPQPHTGIPFEHIMASVGGPCGGVGRLDGPTFGCANGWDWLSGIRDRNSGIWQQVYLSATGSVILKDPLITTDLPLPQTDIAFVTVQTTVQNTTGKLQKGLIKGSFDNIRFEKQVEIAPWQTLTYTFDPGSFSQLKLNNPRLWWPNGLGEPNLYSLRLLFELDGKVSDAQDITFGIREISYDRPGSDNLGLTVNGLRVFCKGGNWGMDEALKRIPKERLEAQVRLHREANFNMIRNWGGQSTSEDLYALCDKYGIMLWDEFFQFNSADPLDQDLFMANVRDKTLRFRNHPSIVIWCGRNEAYPPKYLDDAVRYLLAKLDPLRWYQANSGGGRGCNSGGPYDWVTPTEYYRFSEKSNFNKKETFKTEIGAQSIPTLESIQGMMPEKDWTSITDAWAEKNFIAGGGRKLLKTMTKRYGKVVNVADFVRKSQLMNYEAFRAMYEGRLGQMYTPVEGILLWMSQPAQPSFVWQIYHYDLEPNASYFATKKACEQIHIQFNESNNGVVQVVNHQATPLSGARAKITLYNLNGSIALQHDYDVSAAPCSVTKLDDIQWPTSLTPVHFVKLELRDPAGKLISDNFYWRGIASNPDDLTQLETMPVVKLSTKATYRSNNGKVFVDVTLRNPSKHIALMTHLQLHRDKSKERVLPVYYSDNYISLAPKEEKTITIEASEAGLKGEKPLALIDGWNIEIAPSTYVAANKNAAVAGWPQGEFGFIPPKPEPASEVHLNCGGYNRGIFTKDPGFLEGAVGECTDIIDVSAPNAGPEELYRLVRWGSCSYTSLMKGGAGQTYTLRLHFAEIDKNTPVGKRCFNVVVNGKTVLSDLDVAKEAGGILKALVKEIPGIVADNEQKITIEVKNGKSGAPQISGFEILPR
ncbi:glycosyl hydrolase 2 galactose-binding domain-containing protein [Viscerimonas tarda]